MKDKKIINPPLRDNILKMKTREEILKETFGLDGTSFRVFPILTEDKIFQAMDTHASQVAVAFAEWINRNHYESTLQSKWTNLYEGWLTKGIPSVTTSELFEKFKSENK